MKIVRKWVAAVIDWALPESAMFAIAMAKLSEAKRYSKDSAHAANSALSIIKSNMLVSADVQIHGDEPSLIITIGRYRGADYVKVSPVRDSTFAQVVEAVKAEGEHARFGRMDFPYGVREYFMKHVQG